MVAQQRGRTIRRHRVAEHRPDCVCLGGPEGKQYNGVGFADVSDSPCHGTVWSLVFAPLLRIEVVSCAVGEVHHSHPRLGRRSGLVESHVTVSSDAEHLDVWPYSGRVASEPCTDRVGITGVEKRTNERRAARVEDRHEFFHQPGPKPAGVEVVDVEKFVEHQPLGATKVDSAGSVCVAES